MPTLYFKNFTTVMNGIVKCTDGRGMIKGKCWWAKRIPARVWFFTACLIRWVGLRIVLRH